MTAAVAIEAGKAVAGLSPFLDQVLWLHFCPSSEHWSWGGGTRVKGWGGLDVQTPLTE